MARLLSANIVGALLSFLAIRIHAKSSQHPFMYSNTSFCTPTAVALDFFHRIAFSFFFFQKSFFDWPKIVRNSFFFLSCDFLHCVLRATRATIEESLFCFFLLCFFFFWMTELLNHKFAEMYSLGCNTFPFLLKTAVFFIGFCSTFDWCYGRGGAF